jgi:hypothetical protein
MNRDQYIRRWEIYQLRCMRNTDAVRPDFYRTTEEGCDTGIQYKRALPRDASFRTRSRLYENRVS